MPDNIRKAFKKYQGSNPGANRICNEIMRNGITDMGSLCLLEEREPERLSQMRNIGSKSIEVIASVCSAYRSEKGLLENYEEDKR